MLRKNHTAVLLENIRMLAVRMPIIHFMLIVIYILYMLLLGLSISCHHLHPHPPNINHTNK